MAAPMTTESETVIGNTGPNPSDLLGKMRVLRLQLGRTYASLVASNERLRGSVPTPVTEGPSVDESNLASVLTTVESLAILIESQASELSEKIGGIDAT